MLLFALYTGRQLRYALRIIHISLPVARYADKLQDLVDVTLFDVDFIVPLFDGRMF